MVVVRIVKSCCFEYSKPKIPGKKKQKLETIMNVWDFLYFIFFLYPIGSSLQNSYSQDSSHSQNKEK